MFSAGLASAESGAFSPRLWDTRERGRIISKDAWSLVDMEGIRGVTVGPIESSLQTDQGYGSPSSLLLLDHLKEMHTNWISITPFGRIWDLESVHIDMCFEREPGLNKEGVVRFIEAAHDRGMHVLVVPHLWVEMGGWRGEIDPRSPGGWRAYQGAYQDFLLEWARVAEEAQADMLSIAVEAKSWSHTDDAIWREMIDKVRRQYFGLLTYSANWDEPDRVVFWDALDVIGINAFYPLTDQRNASKAELFVGTTRIHAEVKSLAERYNRPVMFTEIGYTTRKDAGIEPWTWPEDLKQVLIDEQAQADALDVMLDFVRSEEHLMGAFLWRYYANLYDHSQETKFGFSPFGKAAEGVLFDAFESEYVID